MVPALLAQGHEGKRKILGIMNGYMYEKKNTVMKTNLPKTEIIEIPAAKRSKLVGAGGFTLKKVFVTGCCVVGVVL